MTWGTKEPTYTKTVLECVLPSSSKNTCLNINSIYSKTGILGTSQHKRITYILLSLKLGCTHSAFLFAPIEKQLSCLLKWEIPLKTLNDCCTAAQKRTETSSAYQGKLCYWLTDSAGILFFYLLFLYMVINWTNHWVNEDPVVSAVKLPMIKHWHDFSTLNNNMKQRFNLS